MYPSIGHFSGSEQSQGGRSPERRRQHAQPGPPSWPPPQLLDMTARAQNGPSGSGPTSQASNCPMLRVHIADHLRTSPPVMISPSLEDIPRAQFSYSFDYERQLINRLESEEQAAVQSAPASDSFKASCSKFSGGEYPEEAVTMAVAALGASNPDQTEVKQFCKNFRGLREMGFDIPSVVGALVRHKSDLAAATEACLSAQ